MFCIFRFSALIWKLLAIFVASFSTLFYLILQFLGCFASYGSESWICIILLKAFCNTWKNIRIRCSQILYWPIFVRDDYHRYCNYDRILSLICKVYNFYLKLGCRQPKMKMNTAEKKGRPQSVTVFIILFYFFNTRGFIC